MDEVSTQDDLMKTILENSTNKTGIMSAASVRMVEAEALRA